MGIETIAERHGWSITPGISTRDVSRRGTSLRIARGLALVAVAALSGSTMGPERAWAGEHRTIAVQPTGNSSLDPSLVQAAIDNASPGDTILLGAGTFNFGDGSNRATVIVNKGVTIKGETKLELDEEGTPTGNVLGSPTIISGGGKVLPELPIPVLGWVTESGAFRVHSSDASPVAIEGLWLDNWMGRGIVVTAGNGFKLKDCKSTHGNAGALFPGGFAWTDFVFAIGPGVAGTLEADRIFVDLMDVPNDQARGDEIHSYQVVFTGNVQGISIARNNAASNGDLIDIWSNFFAPSTQISVWNSKLTTFRFPIAVLDNVNAVTTIRKNDLRATGVSGIWLTGENFVVENNTVEGAWTGIQLGAPWPGWGTTVSNSIVKNNTVVGGCQYGVALWDASSDNVLTNDDLGGALTPPLPYGAAYYFDYGTRDNVLKAETATVIDNGSNFIKGMTAMTGARPIVKAVRMQLHCVLGGGTWDFNTDTCAR